MIFATFNNETWNLIDHMIYNIVPRGVIWQENDHFYSFDHFFRSFAQT